MSAWLFKPEGELRAYEDKRESFDPACHCAFFTQNVAQSVDWEGLGDRTGCWELLWEVVESVGDSGIFHDIALVQDIRSSAWHLNVERVRVGRAWLGSERHACEKRTLFFSR